MVLTGGSAERKKLLPGSFEAVLKRMAWRILGAALLALALAGWLSLATWSIHDPSLNHATRGATGNLLAFTVCLPSAGCCPRIPASRRAPPGRGPVARRGVGAKRWR